MRCPSCNQENRDGARFCDNCGTPLGATDTRAYAPPAALAEKILQHAPALAGERKQVTVLFADVSGSMDLAERVDPEAWRRIMDRLFSVLCDGVHRFEGTVVQFTGDGIMALFGAPIAHEDHAVRAAHAALRLSRNLAEHTAELRREEGLNFSVRLGLNSGEVVVGGLGADLRVEFTAIGHTVGLAKRMESLAEPGRAYLTEHTASLLDGYFELRDLGRFEVKGVREPVGVHELAGLGRARTRLERARARGFSRFVGRERELQVLEQALEDMLAGEGRIVGVVGEPGVGKSRLCHEFAERARARGLPVFYATGAAHAHSVPYHVALEMLRGYFGLDEGTPPQVARERVAGRLLLLDDRFSHKLPIVFDFLGIPDPQRPAPRMDPDARQRMLMAGAREMLQAHASREAAMNLIEDLHWVDEPSLSFLRALVEAVPDHRSLVVLNFRPEFRADWMEMPEYREISLVPLGAEAVGELLEDLLGSHPSLAGLPEEIRDRTSGNPFFVEELVQALVEDGTLAGPRGARVLTRPLGAIAVPPSVHGVLAGRIDRLAEREKAVLQAASVIGREFDQQVLGRIAGLAPDEALPALVAGGFLVELGDDDVAFRHPLTQEVAYSSLLGETRRRLHGEVAQAVLELYADRIDERAALLAHHWEAADERLEAARWHARAAIWAGTSDAVQAAEHWRAVRTLCSALPDTSETAGLALAACMWTLQFSWRIGLVDADIDALYAEGRQLAARLGDPATEALLTSTWAGVVGLTRNMEEVFGDVEGSMAAVQDTNRPDAEVPMLAFYIYAMAVGGRYPEARRACDRGLELLEHDRTVGAGVVVADPYAWFHMMRGFCDAVMGSLESSRDDLARAIELCAASGDLETAGWAHMNHALLAFSSGSFEGVDEHVLRSVEIADTIGSAFSRIWARFNLGLAHIYAERWDEAISALREGLAMIAQHRTGRESEPWTLTMLGDALLGAGDAAASLDAARRALDVSFERGVVNVRPFARAAIARGLVAVHGVAGVRQAREELERALAEAQRIGAGGSEPIIMVDLAGLARFTGDDAAADRWAAEARTRFVANGATGRLAELDAQEFARG